MSSSTPGKKPKYSQNRFKTSLPSRINSVTITSTKCQTQCICQRPLSQGRSFECFRCQKNVHYCLKAQLNRENVTKYQCLSCISKHLDPLYRPAKVQIQTYFQTKSIFQMANEIKFEFELDIQAIKKPLDIRGFKPQKFQISWPMQGSFYLNDSEQPIKILKPLMANSNRKNRKQEPFTILPQKLKLGKNSLTFKIGQLDKKTFQNLYKFQETGLYFLSIYSINILSPTQCMQITKKFAKFQKIQTLSLMRSSTGHSAASTLQLEQQQDDLHVQSQKINLIDPYTGTRIKFPVRGKYCTHLTTVCMLNYLSIQKQTRTWKCPFCNGYLNEPYVDMWLYQLLRTNPRGSSIQLMYNGGYQWVNQDEDDDVMDLDNSDSCGNDLNDDVGLQNSTKKIPDSQEIMMIDDQDDVVVVSTHMPYQQRSINPQQKPFANQMLDQAHNNSSSQQQQQKANSNARKSNPKPKPIQLINMQSIIEEGEQNSQQQQQSKSRKNWNDYKNPKNYRDDHIEDNLIRNTKNDNDIIREGADNALDSRVEKDKQHNFMQQIQIQKELPQKPQKQINFAQTEGFTWTTSDISVRPARTPQPIEQQLQLAKEEDNRKTNKANKNKDYKNENVQDLVQIIKNKLIKQQKQKQVEKNQSLQQQQQLQLSQKSGQNNLFISKRQKKKLRALQIKLQQKQQQHQQQHKKSKSLQQQHQQHITYSHLHAHSQSQSRAKRMIQRPNYKDMVQFSAGTQHTNRKNIEIQQQQPPTSTAQKQFYKYSLENSQSSKNVFRPINDQTTLLNFVNKLQKNSASNLFVADQKKQSKKQPLQSASTSTFLANKLALQYEHRIKIERIKKLEGFKIMMHNQFVKKYVKKPETNYYTRLVSNEFKKMFKGVI